MATTGTLRPWPLTWRTEAAGAADRRRSSGPSSNAWARLGQATQSLLADLLPVSALMGGPRAPMPVRRSASTSVTSAAHRASQLADRLLKLALAEQALLPADAELDQPVEFVQFSANTRTLLAPTDESVPRAAAAGFGDQATRRGVPPLRRLLQEFLAGLGLDVGASGRQRVAGAHPARPAPHPRRRRRRPRCVPRGTAGGELRRQAARRHRPARRPARETAWQQDLAFLDDHNAEIPVSLPNSALFLAQAWQNLIAANELPTVGEQINADNGHDPSLIGTPAAAKQKPPPDRWATTMHNLKQQAAAPEEFARQLPWCPVRQETLAGELRTPAFARLATKAAAVATAALTTAPETPGAIRPVLTSARTVTRTGYMATKVTGGAAWKILLAGAVLALVGGVMATQGMMVVGLTGTIAALVGLYLIVLGAWELHRGVLGALLAVTVVALLASLTLHWTRFELWGTGKNINSGLVPRTVCRG